MTSALREARKAEREKASTYAKKIRQTIREGVADGSFKPAKGMGWPAWHALWTRAQQQKWKHLGDREAMAKPDFARKLREKEREEAVYALAAVRGYKRATGRPWQDDMVAHEKLIRKYRWVLGAKHKSRSGSKLTWAAGAVR